jgi:DNA-binding MarR family transcriptional regulator
VVSDPAELNLGLLLFIPYRFMESAVLDLVRRHGYDISLSQARVFQRIDAEGSRLSQQAEAAQLPKQTVGSIVDQLEQAGYVRRVSDPDDARARLVVVAEKGRAAIALATPVVEEIEASWRSHLGEARFVELRRSLEELVALTDLDRSNIR